MANVVHIIDGNNWFTKHYFTGMDNDVSIYKFSCNEKNLLRHALHSGPVENV